MLPLCSGVSREGWKGCGLLCSHQSKAAKKPQGWPNGAKNQQKKETQSYRQLLRIQQPQMRWGRAEAGWAVGRCWERGDLEEEELSGEEGRALGQHDLRPGLSR